VKNVYGGWEGTILVLALVSAACLVFNMAAIPIFQEQLFVRRDPLFAVGWVILGGFGLVLMFDIAYAARTALIPDSAEARAKRSRAAGRAEPFSSEMLGLAVGCIIALAGAKVMVDEIGRETLLGWETIGEWILLYTCLTVQLTFIIIAIARLTIRRRERVV
jgi:hypothetical protein